MPLLRNAMRSLTNVKHSLPRHGAAVDAAALLLRIHDIFAIMASRKLI
jgi:hypothetical protein